ncbi:hypothetical protein LZ32DRAFT_150485 [Colletotrichum eremochloae]|nr:hypothetical protein LZ32DRAFT_150485 [Colletotrichum eremochloae]
MAFDTKFDQHLEEGLLPTAANEKGISTSTTISRSTRSPNDNNKMTATRRILLTVLVCGLMTLGLASVITHRVKPCTRDHREQVLLDGGEVQEPVQVDLVHRLLHAYFPERYQDGVYPSDKDAIAAFEADDVELASALGQLAKRQENGTTTAPSATSTPSATVAATPTVSSTPLASETPAPTPTPTPTSTPLPSPSTPATSSTPVPDTTTSSPQVQSNTQQSTNAQSSEPAPTTPTTPATSAAPPTSGTSQTEQAESPSSTVGPSTAPTESPPTTSGSPSSSSSPPSSALSSVPTTASPGSLSASTQDTRQPSTTTRASPRTTSFSEVRTTFTSTASNGDLVLVTQTSFVAVNPEATGTEPGESGSSGGGGLQNAASPISGVSFALPFSLTGFVAGAMLLL